jgi:DNA (cytosine-5)-methyltransferase 1
LKRTFYEFFAGGGMARAGLGDQWQCLMANDMCPKKAAAYVDNWGDADLVVRDVHDIDTSELPGIADLAWASFPCQDLSLAGNGAGLDGERSGAFWGFFRIVESLAKQARKPKVVVLENVYGAITSHDGRDFEAIAKALSAANYSFGAMMVDGVHFVPQSRPRIFIVAVDASIALTESVSADRAQPAWHPDAIIRAYNRLPKKLKLAWRWWQMPAPAQRMQTLEDLIEPDPVGVKWHTAAQTRRLLSMMSPVNRAKVATAQISGRISVGTVYRRTRNGMQRAEVRFDGVSGCLRTPSGGSSRQTIMIVDGPHVRSRLLSPREAARLMGLPDSFKLPLRYNDAYMLAGDGLVVPVVRHIAACIIEPLVQSSIRSIRAA